MTTTTALSEDLIKEILACVFRYVRPKRVLLFGSRARKEHTPTSDIDLAIEADRDVGFLEECLNEEVNTLLKIQVVDLKKAPEALKKQIQREGVVLYEEA